MKITFIRGLPGSGKSTLAKTIPAVHIEADMYFMQGGEYKYDGRLIKFAHHWCLEMFKLCCENSVDVVVSNTFTTKKEMQPYFDAMKDVRCDYEIITLNTQFGSTHNIPTEIMGKMKGRFENILEGKQV